MKKIICSLVLMSFLALGFACVSAKKGKGGSQQPKKGPLPCPLKDC